MTLSPFQVKVFNFNLASYGTHMLSGFFITIKHNQTLVCLSNYSNVSFSCLNVTYVKLVYSHIIMGPMIV